MYRLRMALVALVLMLTCFGSVQAQATPSDVLIQFQATTFTDATFTVTINGTAFEDLRGGELINIPSGTHEISIAQHPRTYETEVIDPVRFTTPMFTGTYLLSATFYTSLFEFEDQSYLNISREYGVFRVPIESMGHAFIPMTNIGTDEDALPFDVYYDDTKVASNLQPGEAVLIPYENMTPRVLGGIEVKLVPEINQPPVPFSLTDLTNVPDDLMYEDTLYRAVVFADFTAGPIGPSALDIQELPTVNTTDAIRSMVEAVYRRNPNVENPYVEVPSSVEGEIPWIDQSGVNAVPVNWSTRPSRVNTSWMLSLLPNSSPNSITDLIREDSIRNLHQFDAQLWDLAPNPYLVPGGNIWWRRSMPIIPSGLNRFGFEPYRDILLPWRLMGPNTNYYFTPPRTIGRIR